MGIATLSIALTLAVALAAYLFARQLLANKRVRFSRRLAGHILDMNRDGYMLLDRELRVQDVNDRLCQLLELPRTALLNRSVFAHLDRKHLGSLAALPGSRPNPATINREIELARPGADARPFRLAYLPLTDQYSLFSGAILLLRDLSAGPDRNAGYQSRVGAVFEHTGEGVMILDTNGRIELVNPAYTKITGFSEDEVRGKVPQALRFGHIWAQLLATGHWQGEIVSNRKDGESYPEWLTISAVHDEEGALQKYVALFSDVSRLKHTEEELRHMAHYDALTDLPNRTLFGIQLNMALERAARRGTKLALFELDLDGFKAVNDTAGHAAGDQLLKTIGGRLRKTLRSEDVVARLGGDEFAMIIENPPNAVHLGNLANKLIAAVSQPVELRGYNAKVTASVGIAIYPQDGRDAEALLKAADIAMYVSKSAGRNTYTYHDDEMTRSANQRLTLERNLRQALDEGQLALYYQPQFNVRSGQVLGVEALLRWDHPELGTVPPEEIIQVAEEIGLIHSLGEWILRQACNQVQAWVHERLFGGTLSVNVSSLEIERPDFAAMVERILAETGLDPRRLIIELTEDVLQRNTKQITMEISRLQAQGVDIAIDDFGKGYSSLSYLRHLSAHRLKIGPRFVQGLPEDKDNTTVTRAIIAIAQALGFELLAGGIETEDQQAFLEREGCTLAQGYLYARPAPGGEFAAWLRERRPDAAPGRTAEERGASARASEQD